MEEFIKALGWPHFSFAFAIIFLALFRKQIAGLISRVTSIDKSGLKASPTPEAQREKTKTEAIQELLRGIGDSIVLRDVEGRIKSELQQRQLDIEGDTVKILISLLAAATVIVQFEQIYNFIFGSQIRLLKSLNEVVGQGLPKENVTFYFEAVRLATEPLANWSFDEYLAFLHGRLLVILTGDTYHITNLGVEFLTWMTKNGRSENRPL
jgi:hypothetical protein